MKNPKCIFFLIFAIQLTGGQNSFAQKTIKIDPELRGATEALTIKRKGASAIGKYEFGSYKIISGHGGWTESSSSSPLFRDHTSIKSSKKMSFVFINDKADTSITNIRIVENVETHDGNWFSRTFVNWTDSDVKKGEGVFEAALSFSSDSTFWTLVVIYPVATEVADGYIKTDSKTTFRGAMTNGTTTIEIKQVNEAEDGKNSMMNPMRGYEFWMDSRSVAALQIMPANKMLLWIHDDLNIKLKFVLATGAAALLVKTF